MAVSHRKLQQRLQVTNEIWRVVGALAASSAVSVLLIIGRILAFSNYGYIFMVWNLVLAWLPLVFAWLWVLYIRRNRVVSATSLMLLILWLGFLPNSFYIITDFIHLRTATRATVLYDVAMLMSFTMNGVVLGFVSMALVHLELLKRLSKVRAHAIITGILLLSSFAIYLGRFLRWNTWDVLVNPAGILFSFSGQITQTSVQTTLLSTTLLFTVLLGSIYMVCWQLVRAFGASQQS